MKFQVLMFSIALLGINAIPLAPSPAGGKGTASFGPASAVGVTGKCKVAVFVDKAFIALFNNAHEAVMDRVKAELVPQLDIGLDVSHSFSTPMAVYLATRAVTSIPA